MIEAVLHGFGRRETAIHDLPGEILGRPPSVLNEDRHRRSSARVNDVEPEVADDALPRLAARVLPILVRVVNDDRVCRPSREALLDTGAVEAAALRR